MFCLSFQVPLWQLFPYQPFLLFLVCILSNSAASFSKGSLPLPPFSPGCSLFLQPSSFPCTPGQVSSQLSTQVFEILFPESVKGLCGSSGDLQSVLQYSCLLRTTRNFSCPVNTITAILRNMKARSRSTRKPLPSEFSELTPSAVPSPFHAHPIRK